MTTISIILLAISLSLLWCVTLTFAKREDEQMENIHRRLKELEGKEED